MSPRTRLIVIALSMCLVIAGAAINGDWIVAAIAGIVALGVTVLAIRAS